ncbi:alpha/beta fold hydrolase [Streptomyces torulosus]|uniref:alpha/beta fold hydrolase n=1 Tax=Streptomyces torulosus TaxID=68276 RepID=UPI0006EB3DE8|nr:hypothetical protein [Streptomyces torulosus]
MAHVPGDWQLLVTGTRGIVERDEVVEFLRRTPGARHEELVAGHNVERDAPDALARVLREHLDGHREPDRRDAPPGGSRTGRWALSSK